MSNLGWKQFVDQYWHNRERDKTGHYRTDGPTHIGQLDAGRLQRKLCDDYIRGLTSEKHRADDYVTLIQQGGEKSAEPSRSWTRFGVVRFGNRFSNGKNDAAGTRSGGGNYRRQQHVGADQGVAEAERVFTDCSNKQKCYSPSETRFDHAARNKESREHQPHNRVGIAAQRFGRSQRARQHDGGDAQQNYCASRNRTDYGANNRGDKDRQQSPRLGRDAGRNRY